MAILLNKIWKAYIYINEDIADPRTKDMYFMSPLTILLITSAYLYFVLKWGPEFMKNRKPINIDKILIVFNVVQIVACAYLVIQLHRYCIMQYNWRCDPVDYSYEEVPMKIVNFTWFYMFIKILDLLDTIFFVLRKKFNQISFLHVYHHSSMVILSWIAVKYYGGGFSSFVGYANSIVHTCMYFYYLMSVWDAKYKKSIWWKKHITQLQFLQFFFLFIMGVRLLLQPDCGYPRWLVAVCIPQNLFIWLLFGHFYWTTYIQRKTETEVQHLLNENTKNLEPSKKID